MGIAYQMRYCGYTPQRSGQSMTRQSVLAWGMFMAIWALAEATGWDRTAAVSGVVAAAIGIGSVVWALWRRWWPTWQERHTFRFDRPHQLMAGKHHTLTITVRFLRNARLNQPMVRLSPYDYDPNFTTLGSNVVSWQTESGFEGFPRQVKRGEKIEVRVHLDAKAPVEGFVRIEASDDHSRLRTFARPLTIFQPGNGEAAHDPLSTAAIPAPHTAESPPTATP
jgi:hypothetical protein